MKIAVVIPVYNEINYIENLIKRILDEETEGLSIDIFAVDGCSTDGTTELLQRMASESDKIIYARNPRRITPAALNIGLELAHESGAEIIQIFGGHSLVSDRYFTSLAALVRNNPDIKVFSPQYGFLPPKTIFEKAVQLFSLSPLGRNWRKMSDLTKPLKGYAIGAFAARREVFEKTGFFSEEFLRNQDNDYLTRIQKAGIDLYTFPEITFYYAPRNQFNKLLKQNFQYGMYLVINSAHHGYKQKAPFLFYLTLLMLLLFMNLGLFLNNYYLTKYSFFTFTFITTFYLYAIVVETIRNVVKSGVAGLLLPFLLIPVHFIYAMGTFTGIIFGVDKDI